MQTKPFQKHTKTNLNLTEINLRTAHICVHAFVNNCRTQHSKEQFG